MSATLRLSGYPAATPVSLQVAGINTTGTGTLSTAKEATPGAAAGAAPTLWGAISHGTELSPASLAVGTWQLDSATIGALGADSPYTSPQTVTEASSSIWGRVNASTDTTEQTFALTAATAYPFVAMLKAGTTAKARIVMRRPSNGLESRLLANTFATVDLSTVIDAGAIDGGAVELLADGFIRMSGVFTPDASGDYTFGVGPNGEGTVELYGGAIAEISGSPPDPEAEDVPSPFASDQWELIDAGTNGTTLIVRILELPASNPALTFIGYRLNGSDASIGFGAIAPGDYQISGLTNGVEASVLLRSANALGGTSSNPKTATPTAATAPDQGAADALTYSNAVYEGKAALDPAAGQIIKLGATTLATSGETYINGVRLYNGDGSQWHVSREGNLSYLPNGAHDALNAGEFTDVSVAWRRTGDVSDRTFTLRVYGSQHTGADLARGVTASTAMTLTSTVAEDEVLEVAFTAGGSACTPSLGGVTGTSCPAGKRDVQYLRAPSGGSAALTFTTTPATVYARVVSTPGDAASIRKLTASRSGTTLSLDWRTTPRAGFPSTAGWSEAGGTPASPEVRDRASSAVGFQTATGSWTQWKFFNAASTRAFVHDARITGVNSVVKLRSGFTNFLMYDVEGYGPVYSLYSGSTLVAGSSLPDRGQLIVPLENVSSWPEQGVLQVYDTTFNFNMSSGNNEAIDGDNYFLNYIRDLYFMNGDWRNTGDAISDMKGFGWFHCMTYGQSWRAIRTWFRSNTFGRTRLDGPYSQADLNLSHRSGMIVLWLCDKPGGARIRDYTDVSISVNLSAFGYVSDERQASVVKAKPAFPPECDYTATDFEFEQSLDGGANWSTLSVERTGPNDCWGATRRTVTGVSTSITHVRARALWGAKVGAWTTAAVTT